MENIRNFVIISHIDHGKSTLGDRFLELTNTIPREKMRPQYLDMMDLERERGITIKMQPVRMNYHFEGRDYVLNLIDTPGHVDFSYEVSRSLAAVEGAILLVDASKGIQAQTVANLEQAQKQNLAIIPALNKIDLPQARIEENLKELSELLKINKEEILRISAKYGKRVKDLLKEVIKKIPSPRIAEDEKNLFKALIFDLKYDAFKGVIAFVRVFGGEVEAGDKIYLIQNKAEGKVKEVGYFKPHLVPQKKLKAGEIGYIATGIKEANKVRVGDTICLLSEKNLVLPLPGYQEPKPMIFASFYPQKSEDFDLLKEALEKIKLTDPALSFEPESKEGLGRGFRCGFLGSLHAEIISERISREEKLKIVISNPSVLYKIVNKKDQELLIKSASDWPDPAQIKETLEPWIELQIFTPQEYLGKVLELLDIFEARKKTIDYLGSERVVLVYEAPLRTIITGFYDRLKGISQGFASMNYRFLEYRKADLVKMEILIAGRKEEAFAKIVPRDDIQESGKKMVTILKETLPQQLFALPIQAVVGGKIIARETIKARRRDVIAPLYGGDYTRKKKLLERQKRGKKELKEKGRVSIPPNVFFRVFKSQ